MMVGRLPSSRPLLALSLAAGLLFLWFLRPTSAPISTETPHLVEEHIRQGEGAGGRWYIPQSWLDHATDLRINTQPLTLLDAAELALELALHNSAFIENSKIPLLVHQKWNDVHVDTWPPGMADSVEEWLALSTGERNPGAPEMAYFLWDDGGVDALVETYEPQFWTAFQKLPYKVEKADVFRVLALKWFGGIYADVDVKPLQHPSTWVKEKDITDWSDPVTAVIHKLQQPTKASYRAPEPAPYNWRNLMAGIDASHLDGVGAIFGIECDTEPSRDDYWRMGYSHPVQVTNWAMAMAPTHPAATVYLDLVAEQIALNLTRLPSIDPLDLSGPPALTTALKNHTETDTLEYPTDWNALSGLQDPIGGRGKVLAGDVLILPITGFSPGRGWFHNMGSQPLTHPAARLFHAAAGTWRKTDIKVHAGKFCRTFFGACRDWRKIPEPTEMPVAIDDLDGIQQ